MNDDMNTRIHRMYHALKFAGADEDFIQIYIADKMGWDEQETSDYIREMHDWVGRQHDQG